MYSWREVASIEDMGAKIYKKAGLTTENNCLGDLSYLDREELSFNIQLVVDI